MGVMLPDLADSVARPQAYRRFSAERGGRTAAYVAFLSLIFVGALGVAVKLRLAPLLNETFDWLATQMPALQYSSGKLRAQPEEARRLSHPRLAELAVMIDTGRDQPVTLDVMKEAKVQAYLTSDALYLEQAGQLKVFDFSKSPPGRPATIDSASYRQMQKAFSWVFYPALLLIFFLLFASSLAVFGALYALAGMLFASIAGAPLGFAALFKIAVHAQTASALLRALDTVLPAAIPLGGLLSLALSLVYVFLGVRAHAAGEPPAPAA